MEWRKLATGEFPHGLETGMMIPVHASILDPGQQARLEGLARELTPAQLAWASGYLAGLAAHGAAPAEPLVATTGVTSRQVTVLFGTETGHARVLAGRIGQLFAGRNTACRVVSMGDYKPRELKDEQLLIVVTATHGEGDPPESARGFFEFLMGRKAPKLGGLRFAVLGLGDSSYAHFCKTARDIDARLEALGATRLQPRVDCDVDFEAAASAWIGDVTPLFESYAGTSVVSVPAGAAVPAATEAGRRVSATVLEHIRLNGRGSDKATWHIELDVSESRLDHLPGDSLGVVVDNDPALVAEVVEQLGLDADEALLGALRSDYELTVLTPGFIEAYARVGGVEPLAKLCADADRAALRRYMDNRQIVDVVREYPLRGLGAGEFTGLLRKLEPRLYSIASSAAAAPGEIHLTVAEVNFRSPFAERFGTASGCLARRTEPGATFQVYVERNELFRLPDDPQVPVIMIGAGTGVAPFRAFLQEREARGISGPSWLFFGDRHFRTDFLYQAEWLQYLREGWLARMDVAFSRDQARKIYVQDRLRERGREVWRWIEDGACLYVCGDAKAMAPDVHAALLDIIATHGGKDEESAREYLNDLTLDRRYRRDVY